MIYFIDEIAVTLFTDVMIDEIRATIQTFYDEISLHCFVDIWHLKNCSAERYLQLFAGRRLLASSGWTWSLVTSSCYKCTTAILYKLQ